MSENGGEDSRVYIWPSVSQEANQYTLAIPFPSLHFAMVPPIGGWGLVSASEGHAWTAGGRNGACDNNRTALFFVSHAQGHSTVSII